MFATLRTSYVKGNAAFNENLVGPTGSVSRNGLVAADYSAGVDLAQLIRVGASAGSALGSKVRSGTCQ